jgi:hypothetical protein
MYLENKKVKKCMAKKIKWLKKHYLKKHHNPKLKTLYMFLLPCFTAEKNNSSTIQFFKLYHILKQAKKLGVLRKNKYIIRLVLAIDNYNYVNLKLSFKQTKKFYYKPKSVREFCRLNRRNRLDLLFKEIAFRHKQSRKTKRG